MSITFFHNDLDGMCSGAIVKMAHPETELIAIDYGQPFPWDKIKKDTKVFMVDFGLQPFGDMIKLAGLCDLVWIDHHDTALKDAKKVGFKVDGLQRDGVAGCELCWEYFFPKEETPEPVLRLGKFDTWRYKGDTDAANIIAFKYGMEARDSLPSNSKLWDILLHPEYSRHSGLVSTILEEGKAVQRYVETEWKGFASDAAFEVELDGLKCIALNRTGSGSLPLQSVWDPKKYDAMLAFGWDKGQWSVGLYTDGKKGIDVGAVAKKHGGGGHVGAAGFSAKELPFKLG
jgi:oligoribonuclease NrnB/cAMP/cGMP phosphodiesterase (DHH superfamily)